MKTIGMILSAVFTLALFAVALAFVGVRLAGLGTFVVTGASMEPTISKGSLVFVSPESPSTIQVGDVITFEHYDQVTTHRVAAITSGANGLREFTTKGDANVIADPEPMNFPGKVGLVRGSFPLAGYVVAYVQFYWRLALLAVAAVVFFGSAALVIFGRDEPVVRRIDATRLIAPRVGRLAVQPANLDEVWAAHVSWLRLTTARQIRAA